jgi:hypothetical protein
MSGLPSKVRVVAHLATGGKVTDWLASFKIPSVVGYRESAWGGGGMNWHLSLDCGENHLFLHGGNSHATHGRIRSQVPWRRQ